MTTLVSHSGPGGTETILWGPIRGSFTTKQSQRDDQWVASFVSLEGKPVMAFGDRAGTLRIWGLADGRPKISGTGNSKSLRLIFQVAGNGPITAISHHPERGFALARSHIVELEDGGVRAFIHLDAEVKDLIFAGARSLAVGTTQGIVVLEI